MTILHTVCSGCCRDEKHERVIQQKWKTGRAKFNTKPKDVSNLMSHHLCLQSHLLGYKVFGRRRTTEGVC